jgi:hypothetical protein
MVDFRLPHGLQWAIISGQTADANRQSSITNRQSLIAKLLLH